MAPEIRGTGNKTRAFSAGHDLILGEKKERLEVKKQVMPTHPYLHVVCILLMIYVLHNQVTILNALAGVKAHHDSSINEICENVELIIENDRREQDLYWTNFFNYYNR